MSICSSSTHGIQFRGVQTKAQSLRIKGKLGFSNHPMLEHFKFLKAHTKVMPKMTIPAPPVLHFRLEPRTASPRSVYPDIDGFFDDLGQAYKQAVQGLLRRRLPLSAVRRHRVGLSLLAGRIAQGTRARCRMSTSCRTIYAGIINAALEGKPADMTITTHVCRGNFRSTWISEGGYEPVAETMLGKVNYDGYFLEYDTERAGGFEPLRFLPKGNKIVVLGLVTSKSGTLEKKDDVKRRIEEAAKFAPLEQFCLSPQCGFASTEEGNVLAEEEQWAKLRMIVELADEVWGDELVSCRRARACRGRHRFRQATVMSRSAMAADAWTPSLQTRACRSRDG